MHIGSAYLEKETDRHKGTWFLFAVCILLVGFALGCQRSEEKMQQPAASSTVKGEAPLAPQTTSKSPQGTTAPAAEQPPSTTGGQPTANSQVVTQPSPERVDLETAKTTPELAKHSTEAATTSGEEGASKVEGQRGSQEGGPTTGKAATAVAEAEAAQAMHPIPPTATPDARTRKERGNAHDAEAASASDADTTRTVKSASPVEPPLQLGSVNISRLNVRQGPDLAATRIVALPQGEQVEILEEKEDRYHIVAHNGSLKGWVAKRYVDVIPLQRPTMSAKASSKDS